LQDGAFEDFEFPGLFEGRKPPIQAKWFTGVLRIGTGEQIAGPRVPFYATPGSQVYEVDMYFVVEDGVVAMRHTVDNRKAGAFLSIEDRKWVYSSAKAVEVDDAWIDARSLSRHPVHGPVKTRGILNSHTYRRGKLKQLSRNKIRLDVPRTPKTEWKQIMLSVPADVELPEDGSFVEIVAEHDVAAGRLIVESSRALKRGETIHHPAFALAGQDAAEKDR